MGPLFRWVPIVRYKAGRSGTRSTRERAPPPPPSATRASLADAFSNVWSEKHETCLVQNLLVWFKHARVRMSWTAAHWLINMHEVRKVIKGKVPWTLVLTSKYHSILGSTNTKYNGLFGCRIWIYIEILEYSSPLETFLYKSFGVWIIGSGL